MIIPSFLTFCEDVFHATFFVIAKNLIAKTTNWLLQFSLKLAVANKQVGEYHNSGV